MNCNHTFPFWSVVPPSHCPRCGQCLHPAHFGPYQPAMPYSPPWPTHPCPRPWGPYYTVTTSTNTAGMGPNSTGDPAVMT
jgi:hypothetical protein